MCSAFWPTAHPRSSSFFLFFSSAAILNLYHSPHTHSSSLSLLNKWLVFFREGKKEVIESELLRMLAFYLWKTLSLIPFLTIFPSVVEKEVFLDCLLQNLSLAPLAVYFIIYPSSVLDSDFLTLISSQLGLPGPRNATWGNILLSVRLGNCVIEFESCFLLIAVTFSPGIHPLILSVLSFPFITVETLFLVSVYSDQKSQHLLDLCHIWHCHSFSFFATVVVSTLKLSLISVFQGPRVLCHALRSSPWFCLSFLDPLPFSAHGDLQCLRHTWLVCVCILSVLRTYCEY